MRKWFLIFVACVPLMLGSSCQWRRYDFNWQTFRFERIGPRSTAPKQTGKTEQTEKTAELPTRKPQEGLSERHQRAIAQGRVYRLYIGKSGVETSVPEENLYLAKNAPVHKIAEILSLLFPAEGPGRSTEMSFLLYKNQEVWEKARSFVAKLDVSSDTAKESDPWQNGLVMLYKSKFPRKLKPQVRYKITLSLNRILYDPKIDAEVRWASGIIISALNVRFAPKDYTLAEATLALSSRIISGDDYSSMVAQYHKIKQLSLQGKKAQAGEYARETLDSYRTWSNTACFELIADYIK